MVTAMNEAQICLFNNANHNDSYSLNFHMLPSQRDRAPSHERGVKSAPIIMQLLRKLFWHWTNMIVCILHCQVTLGFPNMVNHQTDLGIGRPEIVIV